MKDLLKKAKAFIGDIESKVKGLCGLTNMIMH
jgi:hypothetical protein